jgi:hypothetical protein
MDVICLFLLEELSDVMGPVLLVLILKMKIIVLDSLAAAGVPVPGTGTWQHLALATLITLIVNGMNKEKEKNGYIALVSILLISSLTLFLAVNANLFGISESRMALDGAHSSKAYYLANLCAEEALINLKDDLDYSGNETINIAGGSCEILPLEGSGNENRTIKTTGSFDNKTRKIKIDIDLVNPVMEINSWLEVTDF